MTANDNSTNDNVESATAALAAADASIAAARRTLEQGLAARRDAERRLTVLDRDTIMADLTSTHRELAALRQTTFPSTIPDVFTPDIVDAYNRQVDAFRSVTQQAADLERRAVIANGWSYDHPAHQALRVGAGERYVAERTATAMARYWRAALHADARRLDVLRDTIAGLLNGTLTEGSYGMPCPDCGGAMTGYDDQDYYCSGCSGR